MIKILAMTASGLLGLGLAASLPHQDPGGPGGPPEKGEAAKKKDDGGPAGDLRRAHALIRKLQADDGLDGPSRAWRDRAVDLYRRGLKAHEEGDHRLAHEYGAAAHDLARAADHARNAVLVGRPAGDLPPPPKAEGPGPGDAELRRDLRRAHDRIAELGEGDQDSRYYIDAARDLYNFALKQAEAGGDDIDGAKELAKAAEAMSHVPEHLRHAAEGEPGPEAKAEHKAKAKAKAEHKAKAKGKAERKGAPDDGFPPPLP